MYCEPSNEEEGGRGYRSFADKLSYPSCAFGTRLCLTADAVNVNTVSATPLAMNPAGTSILRVKRTRDIDTAATSTTATVCTESSCLELQSLVMGRGFPEEDQRISHRIACFR